MIQEIEPIMNVLTIIDKEESKHEYNLVSAAINLSASRVICALKEEENDDFLNEWIQVHWDAAYYAKIEKDDIVFEFKHPLRITSVSNDGFEIITFLYSTLS